jgi:YidC/Oxa1 family membrane protein insertase
VVVVRLLLHPITKKSTISMQSMGKMGPEMERLRKKYGDNKEELNKAMMQFYKTQGVTPILGCLPMFLQMPIWIALWSMLQNTFELRQAPFFYGLTWIHDLSQPDHLITFSHPVHILFFTIDGLNLLPIILGGVYFLQQKYTPRPPAATPEQEKQQKMMQWMSLLFPLFLYTGPSGLNLYIATSSGIGILEQKRIRDHINRQQEAEKAGKVLVDVKPTRASRRGRDDEGGSAARGPGKKPSKPSGGLGGWIADLQAKAEEMRRASDRKK